MGNLFGAMLVASFVYYYSSGNKGGSGGGGFGGATYPPVKPEPKVLDWQSLFLIEKVGKYNSDVKAFALNVIAMAARLGCSPHWLMGVMYFESKFSPSVRNESSTATGLIQFLASTARSLGTTTTQLSEMSGLQQLYYVERYLSPYKGKLNGFIDVYLAVFYPKALAWSDSKEFPMSVRRVNGGFVLNGRMNRETIRTVLYRYVPGVEKYDVVGSWRNKVGYDSIGDRVVADLFLLAASSVGSIAVRVMQQSVNNVGYTPALVVDGVVGPKTLAGINGVDSQRLFYSFSYGMRPYAGSLSGDFFEKKY